jgi:7-carboxy-7-deazaguanine synthase
MRIAEIYKSIQGEGFLTGTDSVFVRTSGCNLRCWFCDTPYASWHPEGEDLSVDEVVGEVERLGGSHVVLTGGEPMLFAEVIELCHQLHLRACHITVETAGTLFLPLACDLMSISPKLASSAPDPGREPRWHLRHQRTRSRMDVVRRLVGQYCYQLKFVIDRHDDLEEVEDYLRTNSQIDRSRVLLMPQGTDMDQLNAVAAWLRPYCTEHGLHFCPRMHIEWFGLARGT